MLQRRFAKTKPFLANAHNSPPVLRRFQWISKDCYRIGRNLKNLAKSAGRIARFFVGFLLQTGRPGDSRMAGFG
jgi:hypothetical protein